MLLDFSSVLSPFHPNGDKFNWSTEVCKSVDVYFFSFSLAFLNGKPNEICLFGALNHLFYAYGYVYMRIHVFFSYWLRCVFSFCVAFCLCFESQVTLNSHMFASKSSIRCYKTFENQNAPSTDGLHTLGRSHG